METTSKKTWLDRIPPRIRDFGMTRYGYRPLVPLTVVLILGVLFWKFQDAVTGTLWPWFWEGMKRLMAHPIGPFGLSFVIYLGVLVGAAWIETSPSVVWMRNRWAKTTMLSATERAAVADLAATLAAIKYGAPRLVYPDPLNGSDIEFLQANVKELHGFLETAYNALWEMLQKQLLWEMWERGKGATDHYLGRFVQDTCTVPSKKMIERLTSQVEMACDSREALTAACDCYAINLQWFHVLTRCTGREPTSFEGYELWKESHEQYETVLKRKLELPQFTAVKKWYYSPSRATSVIQ